MAEAMQTSARSGSIFGQRRGGLTARSLLFLCSLPARWLERRRQRRYLADLYDRLLADIGLSRDDRAIECAKPFWRL